MKGVEGPVMRPGKLCVFCLGIRGAPMLKHKRTVQPAPRTKHSTMPLLTCGAVTNSCNSRYSKSNFALTIGPLMSKLLRRELLVCFSQLTSFSDAHLRLISTKSVPSHNVLSWPPAVPVSKLYLRLCAIPPPSPRLT